MPEIPNKMTCIEIRQPGGPEALVPAQRKIPEPGSEEVLIRVSAAGVNRPDVMQRQGLYPPPAGASDIPGLEIAGEVVRVGEGVSAIKTGDKVCALITGGGYAEYCIAPAALCLPIPAGLTLIEAAALPETFFTVWTNVIDRGRLGQGETLLVHGGSSGIGTTAIQIAKLLPARVFVTAGSDRKRDACLGLGADAAINYCEQDFVEEIAALTEGRGVDVILDMVGGDYFPRNLQCLAVEGRLVQIALQHGPKSEISLLKVMLNRLTVTGSTLRPRSVNQKAEIARSLLDKVWPAIEQGKLKPLIHAEYPLAEADRAHQLMESSEHIGKIVLINR